MLAKTSIKIVFTVFLIGISVLTFHCEPIKSEPTIIYVDDDNFAGPWSGTEDHPYQNITSGLEHALDNYVVFVQSGRYYEHVVVEDSISLIGNGSSTTIIDGNKTGHVVSITRDHVTIKRFTIQRSGRDSFNAGISLSSRKYCDIAENRIVDNEFGVYGSPENTSIINNNITNNHIGVAIDPGATSNIISRNSLMANTVSIHIYHADSNTFFENDIINNWRSITIGYSRNNRLYHNYLFNNTEPILILTSGYTNFWDDGYPSGGNYWSNYNGTDSDDDGIGDTPYIISEYNQDNYPLMKPYTPPLGDINHDSKVDMRDIATAAWAFGAYPAHLRWNIEVDVNQDNMVDMKDLILIARHFGETYL